MRLHDNTSEARLNRIFFSIGMLFQVGFLVAAVVFFKERTLYADTAHFAAEIAGTGTFYWGHRLLAIVTRFMPVVATLYGASIETILILYSVNLALVFVIPYILIAYVFRDRKMALVLLLFQFIFTYRTFYIGISELQHGLALLILYWSYIYHLQGVGKRPTRSPGIYVLLILIMNCHPLILFPFLVACMTLSEHQAYWQKKEQRALIPIAAFFYIVSSSLFYTKYEELIVAQALTPYENGINIYYIRLMISTLIREYWPTHLVGVAALVMLMRKYSRVKAFWIITFICMIGVFVYFRFANTVFTKSFFEIYLLPIPFILFLIVAIQLHYYSNRTRMIGVTGVLVLMLIQGVRIHAHGDFYRNRIEIYQSILAQMEAQRISKTILPFYQAPMEEIVDFYATPFESFLLSYLDESPSNNGFTFSYLPADSIDLEDQSIHFMQYPNDTIHIRTALRHDAFIGLGYDYVHRYPFEDYPNFSPSMSKYRYVPIRY